MTSIEAHQKLEFGVAVHSRHGHRPTEIDPDKMVILNLLGSILVALALGSLISNM